MSTTPRIARALSLAGGLLTLLLGIWTDAFFLTSGSPVTATALTFIVMGAVISGTLVLGAVMFSRKPQQHILWGAVVFLLGLLSGVYFRNALFALFGFLMIGPLMSLIGGAWGFFWETPSEVLTVRPKLSSIICLVGGLTIFLIEGFMIWVNRIFGGDFAFVSQGIPLIAGLVIIVSGLFVYAMPRLHQGFGVLVIAMSLLSFLDPQQFILGPFIALIGGIVAMVR